MVHSDEQESSVADEFAFLLTTDNHLGVHEGSALYQAQVDDSFIVFEEIMSMAAQHNVDAILHSGDMFNDASPSKETLNRTAEIFSGGYSAPASPPTSTTRTTVSVPMFAIHSNHDAPTGVGQIAAMDILSSGRWLNYIGKTNPVDEIHVRPVLLHRGAVRVAVYGLGYIHERKLHELMANGKVVWDPPPSPGHVCVLLVHQNRRARKAKWFLDPAHIPPFTDVVLWGHEHDCTCLQTVETLKLPQGGRTAFLLQLGSSVATSLSEAEAGPKVAAIFRVRMRDGEPEVKLDVHRLRCVRPVVFSELAIPTGITEAAAVTMVGETLERMSRQASKEVDPRTTVPLLRLRVRHDASRIADNYGPIVAELAGRGLLINPHNAILKSVKRGTTKDSKDSGLISADEPKLEYVLLRRLVGRGRPEECQMKLVPASMLLERHEVFMSARGNLAELVLKLVDETTEAMRERLDALGLRDVGARAPEAKAHVVEVDSRAAEVGEDVVRAEDAEAIVEGGADDDAPAPAPRTRVRVGRREEVKAPKAKGTQSVPQVGSDSEATPVKRKATPTRTSKRIAMSGQGKKLPALTSPDWDEELLG
ncbi:Double-strand break repair protein MRE11 [Carpediemonas membranifera]|uniref:Double-strand break repair protein MRE11 n=1 Tax=Carpediemonas membranifera TaxID=201153 RepID=A0A8J6B6S5_9EUKA|nr:Double-strand break repair protein MRE11 [Carpediemonas membranifera]|eukprot:KAG9391167.1 Double-strand break repair protein MRE11 [Carpediemonas membranifera]